MADPVKDQLPVPIEQDTASLMRAQEITPIQMLKLLVDQGADPDKLQKMMEMKERWEANEARKAFSAAFAAFKNEAVIVVKGTEVKDGPLKGKFHANLFDVVSAVTPYLSKHGLSISWKLTKDEKDWMEVTCTLRHIGGHSESSSMGGAPDTGPGRNAIQARGSSKTYLERYTATAILGLAAQDADKDGAGEPVETITEKQAADLDCLLSEVKADRPAFLLWLSTKLKMTISGLDKIPAKAYTDAVAAVEAKRKAVKQ